MLAAGRCLLCIMATTLMPLPLAHAGFLSGADLLDACSPGRADPLYRLKVSECRGYVLGVADVFDCSQTLLGFSWNGALAGNQEELVTKVVNWLRGHPKLQQFQAGGLVAAALADSYACPDVTASTPKASANPN